MKEKKTKILLVLPFFYPHRGGSQKYAEEIFAAMKRNHKDVDVDVLCYNTDNVAKYEEYRGFKIYRIPCWNIIPARFALANPVSLIKTLYKLSKNNYNYVNTHIRFFDPTWWLWIYAKAIGAKSIFTGHVATHPVHQNKIVEFVSKLVDLTIAKASLRFYDYITFTNKAAENFFRDRLGVKKNSYLFYGGVDTSFFHSKDKQSRRIIPKINVEIGSEIVLITYVGRMIWTKGVTFLYEAIREVLGKGYKDVIFVLAGPGELEQELRTKIKKDELENKVFMTGDLKYEEVRDLLGISDVFINPSHHNEGFPNTVLEAGSSGCFVIATDNAGTHEVVKNFETGILVPQKDAHSFSEAIEWIANHPEKRKEIANNFRNKLVNEFDWNIISDRLYKLLTSKSNDCASQSG